MKNTVFCEVYYAIKIFYRISFVILFSVPIRHNTSPNYTLRMYTPKEHPQHTSQLIHLKHPRIISKPGPNSKPSIISPNTHTKTYEGLKVNYQNYLRARLRIQDKTNEIHTTNSYKECYDFFCVFLYAQSQGNCEKKWFYNDPTTPRLSSRILKGLKNEQWTIQ